MTHDDNKEDKEKHPNGHKEEEEEEESQEGEKMVPPPRRPIVDSKWETMYIMLLKYKEENGDTLVPNRFPKLGSWISVQRRYYKDSMLGKETPLTPKRIQMLQDVGFVWEAKNPRHVPWETRYQELVDYQSLHGNCLVPMNYSENTQLAIWVSTQRKEYKLWNASRPCHITSQQIQLLKNIGFSFEPPRGGCRVMKRRKESEERIDSKCRRSDNNNNNKVKTPFIPIDRVEGGSQLKSRSTTSWIRLFKEYLWHKDNHKDFTENPCLNIWYQQQKEQLKRWKDNPNLSELNPEHVSLLKSAGFDDVDESQTNIADKSCQENHDHNRDSDGTFTEESTKK